MKCYKVNKVKGVFRIKTFPKLTMVVTIDKELQISDQGVHPSGKAT